MRHDTVGNLIRNILILIARELLFVFCFNVWSMSPCQVATIQMTQKCGTNFRTWAVVASNPCEVEPNAPKTQNEAWARITDSNSISQDVLDAEFLPTPTRWPRRGWEKE